MTRKQASESEAVRLAPWNRPVAMWDEVSGQYIVPTHEDVFPSDAPFVRAHAWAFATEADIAAGLASMADDDATPRGPSVSLADLATVPTSLDEGTRGTWLDR